MHRVIESRGHGVDKLSQVPVTSQPMRVVGDAHCFLHLDFFTFGYRGFLTNCTEKVNLVVEALCSMQVELARHCQSNVFVSAVGDLGRVCLEDVLAFAARLERRRTPTVQGRLLSIVVL